MFAPIKTPVSNTPVQMTEIPEISEAFAQIQKIEAQPNILTVEEFREFEGLWQKDNGLDKLDVRVLTNRFHDKVDLYKETHIVVSAVDRRVVVRLPALLIPVPSMAATKANDESYTQNTLRFGDQIPRVSSDAFNTLMNNWKRDIASNQRASAVLRQKKAEIIKEFDETYGKKAEVGINLTTASQKADPAPPATHEVSGVEWE